jgi:cytochrome c oxidase subunit 1
MHIIGASGLPRRYAAYAVEPGTTMQWSSLQPWNEFMTIAAIGLGLSQIPFFLNFFISLARGPRAAMNPWNANTLEWTLPSPPVHGNYYPIPEVYRGPYEYSSPLVEEDYLPQSRKLEGEAAAAEERLQARGH